MESGEAGASAEPADSDMASEPREAGGEGELGREVLVMVGAGSERA